MRATRSLRHQMLGPVASNIMARTTLDLDASVLSELRRRGQSERKTMGQVASELAPAFAESTPPAPPPRFSWLSADLGAPRVDLEDKEALRRVLAATPSR